MTPSFSHRPKTLESYRNNNNKTKKKIIFNGFYLYPLSYLLQVLFDQLLFAFSYIQDIFFMWSIVFTCCTCNCLFSSKDT